MNAIVVIDTLTPAVFAKPGGIEALLSKLETDVRAVKTDIATKSGREAVASLAYQVSRSKTALDSLGKELGEGHYKSWKAICAERARIETRLDALRDEVRKPLDDYEALESDRVAGHQGAIQTIIDLGTFDAETPTSGTVIERLTALDAIPARDWQEFEREAEVARLQTFAKLTALKESALQRESEAAELERLRIEKADRERQEREDRIAAEAAARATQEAEAKAAREAQEVARAAAAERDRLERERAQALAQAQRAAQEAETERLARDTAKIEAVAAAARAAKTLADQIKKDEDERRYMREAEEVNRLIAIETERKRVADIKAAEDAETARREADREHRKAINSEALAAFVAAGIPLEHGMKAVAAIASGQIPGVHISY